MMHPLESKTGAVPIQSSAPKTDLTASQRIRLQGLLGPIVGISNGYRRQIEAQVSDLGLAPEHRADLDGVLEAMQKLEQHAKRLLV